MKYPYVEVLNGCRKNYGILQQLYKADEFEQSPRELLNLFNEACTVYQVVYEYTMSRNDVAKCGFAWKVAGCRNNSEARWRHRALLLLGS
jgi:hypothetical protein